MKELHTELILTPILAVCCQLLCDYCQITSPDPWIIQPVLDQIGDSVQNCKGVEGLRMLQQDINNLQALSATLRSLDSSPSFYLDYLEGDFFYLCIYIIHKTFPWPSCTKKMNSILYQLTVAGQRTKKTFDFDFAKLQFHKKIRPCLTKSLSTQPPYDRLSKVVLTF